MCNCGNYFDYDYDFDRNFDHNRNMLIVFQFFYWRIIKYCCDINYNIYHDIVHKKRF